MYEIINDIIAHTWTTGTSEQSYIYNFCGVLICLFVVILIDVLRDIFSAFWRG